MGDLESERQGARVGTSAISNWPRASVTTAGRPSRGRAAFRGWHVDADAGQRGSGRIVDDHAPDGHQAAQRDAHVPAHLAGQRRTEASPMRPSGARASSR